MSTYGAKQAAHSLKHAAALFISPMAFFPPSAGIVILLSMSHAIISCATYCVDDTSHHHRDPIVDLSLATRPFVVSLRALLRVALLFLGLLMIAGPSSGSKYSQPSYTNHICPSGRQC